MVDLFLAQFLDVEKFFEIGQGFAILGGVDAGTIMVVKCHNQVSMAGPVLVQPLIHVFTP